MKINCRQCGGQMDLYHRQLSQQSYDMALAKWREEEPTEEGVLRVFKILCWEQQKPLVEDFYFLYFECPECTVRRVIREKRILG